VVPALVAPLHVATLELVGPWDVRVRVGSVDAVLTIPPASIVSIQNEKHESLPLYNATAAAFWRGAKLKALATKETTAADGLAPGSLVVKLSPDGAPLTLGTDYDLETKWANVGRLAGGAIAESAPVWLDYQAGLLRVDSIVVAQGGRLAVRTGEPHPATPTPGALLPGDRLIARIFVPARAGALTEDCLFPITEPTFPTRKDAPRASETLAKTWAKLQRGEPVEILAWGDSVTAGGEASSDATRWQSVFLAHLKKRFPKAQITLTTVAWGGRNSDSFLAEPPGSPYNFAEKVLAAKPDLIVMEFVNDAGMSPEVVEQKYTSLKSQFDAIGAEWCILTPHFVRPDWMGQTTVKVEADPRPYVAGVRAFCAKHHVALADASLRWGHLVKEGVPYVTLLSNSINHPNDHGHRLFADALMELFR